MSDPQHFDVLILGAGLSGIGAAWHLQTLCPGRRYAILEAREAMGGTWDLFRYPGVRSDSDMYTLGYRFRPWREAKAIADGPSIKAYIEETAREAGIDRHIRFGHRVVRLEWSTRDARWTVHAEVGPDRRPARFTCGFIHGCTGYYRYASGYTPELPGLARFRGRVVHPQQWPEGLDYRGQRVVVIGSGATAVTLVPAMSTGEGAAAHVTMLQRSPTYVAALPSQDAIADFLRRVLPDGLAYALSRWKNILRSQFFYIFARRAPRLFKAALDKGAESVLGPGHAFGPHFSPRYRPWDERLCIIPDSDLFHALKDGRASVVTDTIETFDETGIRLASGAHLDADLVVTATGLVVSILDGITLVVDGASVRLRETLAYKGMMFSGVPNLVASFGYTNASWTLKCDLVAEHTCRLLNHMAAGNYAQVTAVRDPAMPDEPVLDFTSGYVQRALPTLPRQGTQAPWRLNQNYVLDLLLLRWGRVDDPALEFRRAAPSSGTASGPSPESEAESAAPATGEALRA